MTSDTYSNKDLDHSEMINEFPEVIENFITISEPNAPIKIYDGEFLLKNDSVEIKVNGSIEFRWIASSSSYFSGNVKLSALELMVQHAKNESYKVIVDGLEFGEGYINGIKSEAEIKGVFVRGFINGKTVFGDKSIGVEKILFSIPNLRLFFGLPVKKTTSTGVSNFLGRLKFENDMHIMTIDKCIDYAERLESLKAEGGYSICYNGELVNKNGTLRFEDIQDVFHCFSTFITFLNGRKTSTFFHHGVFKDEIKWCDYTAYKVDSYKNVKSWATQNSSQGFNEMWQKFSLMWQNKDDKHFLIYVIGWYVAANSSENSLEGSVMMAQTALELLYNWWIVEHKRMIVGKDSENINASNKIRLLLSQMNIPYTVPTTFKQLRKFVQENKDVVDAPDAIVQARNAIVHSQIEKRKKISDMQEDILYQIKELSVWYIEMSILCILGFNDKYDDRLSNKLWVGESDEYVPWKENEK